MKKAMKYKHVSQKPYSCVPACMQMILWRRNLPPRPQASIAYDLGIILPPSARRLLPQSYKGKKPPAGWGTRLNLKKYSLAAFFKRHQYPLQTIFHSAKEFRAARQFKKFLLNNLNKNHDLLVCFNYPRLYHLTGSWGHAALIEEVTPQYVILCDPSSKHKTTEKILLTDLLAALKKHYQGGLWVIKETPIVKH